MEHAPAIEPSSAGRAALERLARRGSGDRVALRAQGVLMLEKGASKAEVARTLRVGAAAVRAWEKRWLSGGAEALRADSGRVRVRKGAVPLEALSPVTPPAEAAVLSAAAGSRPGRRADARIAVEVWIRDATALGLLAPGARLPERAWFEKRLRAGRHAVGDAFAALVRGGFVRSVPRIGAFVASPPPFEGRYLMLVARSPDGMPSQGLDVALTAAARAQEARRGVTWEIAGDIADFTPARLNALWADVAAQRWAGVFVRALPPAPPEGWLPLRFRRVPIAGMLGRPVGIPGSFVRDFESNASFGRRSVFGAIGATGLRRVCILDYQEPRPTVGDERIARLRKAVADCGLELPESGYLAMPDSRNTETAFAYLSLFAEALKAVRPEAVAVLQDNFVPGLCDALVRVLGEEAARRIAVFAVGNRPALPETRLPVVWHGFDFDATLDSFADWCDAIHAGAKTPPPPRLATF